MSYWNQTGNSDSNTRDVGLGGSYWLERLLSGVCAYVVIEGCCSGECSATISTFERSVAGVRHHVIPQIGWLREGLGTMATLVGSKREDSNWWGNKLVFLNKIRVMNNFCSITNVDISFNTHKGPLERISFDLWGVLHVAHWNVFGFILNVGQKKHSTKVKIKFKSQIKK